MQRETAVALMGRAVAIGENQWPEMADAHMEVPLDYLVDEEFAAKERMLFETSPLALVAASEDAASTAAIATTCAAAFDVERIERISSSR